jgi:hypothetical protein
MEAEHISEYKGIGRMADPKGSLKLLVRVSKESMGET